MSPASSSWAYLLLLWFVWDIVQAAGQVPVSRRWAVCLDTTAVSQNCLIFNQDPQKNERKSEINAKLKKNPRKGSVHVSCMQHQKQ